jgi:hypothetical protein
VIVNDVIYPLKAWNLANNKSEKSPKLHNNDKFKAPPEDYYKINCDGAFMPEISYGGRGFIIRGHA